MLRCALLAFSIIVAATVACGQEHAPTLEQCRADRDLWIYQIPKGPTAEYEEVRNSMADINSDSLRARQVEMMICMTAIDPMPDTRVDLTSVTCENFYPALTAHLEKLTAQQKWQKYMLLRLVYAEEIEERLMALVKAKK